MTRVVGSIAPHGGQLVNRTLRGSLREAALERAAAFPQVQLTRMAAADLEMLAIGAFSPLTGFMTKEEYDSVLDAMRLPNNLPWTLPVTLPVDDETAAGLEEGQEIALAAGEHLMGIMTIAEKFEVPLAALIIWNRIDHKRPIHPGDRRGPHPPLRPGLPRPASRGCGRLSSVYTFGQ